MKCRTCKEKITLTADGVAYGSPSGTLRGELHEHQTEFATDINPDVRSLIETIIRNSSVRKDPG